mmetsp:Transcript_26809/g.25853  ORF Transcript_26809/g.25853 Transcript_26809/m.25853 type:complete len:167 (-) Transcript_26809:783-1283(-)
MKYFTDDSMFAMNRPSMSSEDAIRAGIYRGEDQGLKNEGKKLSEPLNTFPVNSGLILQSQQNKFHFTFGMVLSHALMGHFISNNTFDLMVTRSERNEDTKGLWREPLIDEGFAYLEVSAILDITEDKQDSMQEFYSLYSKAKKHMYEGILISKQTFTSKLLQSFKY